MIIENSKDEFIELPNKNRKIRKGYLGHLNKIANDILRCGNIDDNIQKYLKNSDWLNYVNTVLKKTNDINNTEVGGSNPRNLMSFNPLPINEPQFGMLSSDYKPIVFNGDDQIQEGESSTTKPSTLSLNFINSSIPDILKSKSPPLYSEIEQINPVEYVKSNDTNKSPDKKVDDEAKSPTKQANFSFETDPSFNSNIELLSTQKNIVEISYINPILSPKNDLENNENNQFQPANVLIDPIKSSNQPNLKELISDIDIAIKEHGMLFELEDI